MNTLSRYDRLIVYVGVLIFIILNAFLMLREFFWLPVIAMVPVLLYYAFFSLNKLFFAVVFLTPLSVELSRYITDIPFDVSLPTEPLILIIVAVAGLSWLHRGAGNASIFFHPVSLAVLFYLAWLLISTMASTMPVVSIKFFFVRFWFIAAFFFVAIRIFAYQRNIDRFIWCYAAALALVAVYTLYNHAEYGLIAQREAHWVVRPFYNDHTSYGAALAFFIPPMFYFAFRQKSTVNTRRIAGFLLLLFTFALIFSYSRAAWVSVAAALAVWVVMKMRLSFSTVLTVTLLSAVMVFMLRHEIIMEMERNTQDSSADFREHVRSITNISSDASNLERINRWNAAIGMFREKPLFGWGPGTYMFMYAPFQYSYNRTIISTNLADGGDAHSEYLGPLSETGVPGLLSVLAIVFFTLFTGFRLLHTLKDHDRRLLVTVVLLSLITYLVHGVLNNFLHTDKLSVPFWGFAAIIVAIDHYSRREEEGEKAEGTASP
ncbi:MAG: hypothetical protein EA408_01195 [Marinilabiliales bacterium]|nr:MAG: hypothetical protein EA408_01195 [Marinilabiliales bacterium]